jgi:predicted O-methyltransferase YrrM
MGRSQTIDLERVKLSLGEGAYFARCLRKLGSVAHKQVMRHALRQAGVSGADRIFTHTHQDELESLFRLAQACPRGTSALEIGSYLGASACYIGAGLKQKGGRLFCVDTWNNETMPDGERNTFAEFQVNTKALAPLITTIRKRSSEISCTDLQVPLNFVFIDGDHSYEAVSSDFQIIEPWLSASAVVALHDTTLWEGVSRLLGHVLAGGSYRLVGHVRNLSWIRRSRSAGKRMSAP